MTTSAEHIPQTREPRLFAVLVAISLGITLPYALGWELPDVAVFGVFGFFILITGIPHGAVDHIVAARVFGLQQTFGDQMRFYGSYLLTMLLFGLLWVLSPLTGFILFLVISVYHFGQGDLNWLDIPGPAGLMLYVSRGIMLLALPVLGHLEITAPIVREVSGLDLAAYPWLESRANLLAIGSWVLHIVTLVAVSVWYRRRVPFQEVFLAVVLGITLFVAHPLVGFGIYFGLWHGLNHFFELRDHLYGSEGSEQNSGAANVHDIVPEATSGGYHNNDAPPKTAATDKSTTGVFANILPIYMKTLPFTGMSLLGLVLLWYILGGFGIQERMISVLFILISVLTLPHMFIIHRLYRSR
jgi:beta-carotene 15,15'-dioxygenase